MLIARLDTDDGARRVGEFAIGTNEMITRAVGDTLFDEKIGGTCHLALGRSFPLLGGDNVSAIHWDLVCDLRAGGRIDADGEPLAGRREAGGLMDPFDDLYARVIVEHALAVQAGQSVLIEGGELAEPLAARGASPRARGRRAPDAAGAPGRLDRGQGGVRERRGAGASPTTLKLDLVRARRLPRHAARARERRAARARRAGARRGLGDGRDCAPRTCSSSATPAARRSGAARSTRPPPTPRPPGSRWTRYRDLLGRALKLDQPDPVVAWRAQGELQDALVEQLAAVDELRIVAEGTDLRVRVGGRRWISACGRHNLPDGEVFTGPHEDATEGVVTFAMPSAWGGQRVEGARLRFEAGRCVEAEAESGEAFLRAALDTDEGARTLGEFAFGLNEAIREPTLDTLLDEKIGGTVHMALGAAYAVTGGLNKSALHWDLVCDLRDGGEVYADGRLIQRDGRFLGDFA